MLYYDTMNGGVKADPNKIAIVMTRRIIKMAGGAIAVHTEAVVVHRPKITHTSMKGGVRLGGKGSAVLTYKVPDYIEGIGSRANYSPTNVAWLMEWFGNMFGVSADKITFCYTYASGNWVGHFPSIDVESKHPLDKEYLPAYMEAHQNASPEQSRYEERAKQSVRLMNYEQKVGIKYFQ